MYAILLFVFSVMGLVILMGCSDNPSENPQGKPSKQSEETH